MSLSRKQHVVNDHIISVLYSTPEKVKDKRTIVLLHGWGSEARIWNSVMEDLSKNGFKCIAPDLPGFGQSQFPQHTFTLDHYVDIVQNLIFQCEIEDYVFISHSFGGRISIKIASRQSSFLNKIVLTGSAGVILPDSKVTFLKKVTSLGKRLFPRRVIFLLKKKYYNSIGASETVAIPELEETFKQVVGEDLTHYLKKIIAPTLLIWGEHDNDAPLEIGRIMMQEIPHVSMNIYSDAGHYAFKDNEQRFINDVKEFLTQS